LFAFPLTIAPQEVKMVNVEIEISKNKIFSSLFIIVDFLVCVFVLTVLYMARSVQIINYFSVEHKPDF
jgi:hypothetical protein